MLKAENCLAIVIDVQGKLAQLMDGREDFFAALKTSVKGLQAIGVPVIHLEQCADKLGPTSAEIAELFSQPALHKTTFSACGSAALLEVLEHSRAEHLILLGIEAHVCVYQSAMDLLAQDYAITLVTDAIASRNSANKALALQKMSAGGAHLSSSEMLLFELLQSTEHPAFREVIKLVK